MCSTDQLQAIKRLRFTHVQNVYGKSARVLQAHENSVFNEHSKLEIVSDPY